MRRRHAALGKCKPYLYCRRYSFSNIVRKTGKNTRHGRKECVIFSHEWFVEGFNLTIIATGATIAFYSNWGGQLTHGDLNCMEAAITRDVKSIACMAQYIFKQVYIYGALDRGLITLNRNFGFAWGENGFLLFNALGK